MRSHGRHRGRGPKVDLTPLLDAVFLVVVLLLCAFLHMRVVRAMEVERPVVASGSSALNDRRTLQVAVTQDGRITFEGAEVPLENLSDRLARRCTDTRACLITADRRALHGVVTDVLVAAKQALGPRPTYFEVKPAHE